MLLTWKITVTLQTCCVKPRTLRHFHPTECVSLRTTTKTPERWPSKSITELNNIFDIGYKLNHFPPMFLIFSMTNKNMLEACKNSRPTSGWSELPKSCKISTMNFHMVYFSWIPQNDARLKLSCKFGDSKCNPYWGIAVTSHGTNYVFNEHLKFSQHDPYAIPSEIISWYKYMYSASFKNQTEPLIELLDYWVIGLLNSFDTNYILNNDKDLGQYDLSAILSQIMPC